MIGWQSVFNNSFTIQFGLYPTRVSEATVVFPLTYPNAGLCVVMNVLTVSNGGVRRVSSLTTSQFVSSRSGDVNTAFYWLSVGF